MSTASAHLAEAYAMKKLHKEKMKSFEKEEFKRPETCSHLKKSSSGGWFTKMFKKVHPVTAPASDSKNNKVLATS
ncbi:hypothetical protein FXO38_07812 [Capsicum annuum]|uniref:Uncharacterized protein n=1 Tax=Capsicum annuum TaxID=4072 RepID=A0A2G2ZQ84_CAPAN|nr:hypothetical protein FXO38_07812 [Capsicum annuum]PHT84143.1 hypothetical protein T459_12586 [Capsicum annuum]